MQNQEPPVVFDKERASSYDTQYAKVASLSDALHLLVRVILSDLPADARILCVGVGTGSEMLSLAREFPQWQFTAVEPAAPMLDICRKRAEDAGITARCTFHEGYLDTLPASPPFDGATSLLVSHFIVDSEAQRDFYRQIAARLRPDGCLVAAALVADPSAPASPSLLDVWMRMQEYAGVSAEALEKMRGAYGRTFAAHLPREVEEIIASSGFRAPVLFFQTLLIHSWYAKRAATTSKVSIIPEEQDMQSELERNKEAVTRFNKEVIEQGNVDAFQSLMNPEFVRSAPPGMDSGPNGMLDTFNTVLRPAMPDMTVEILDQVAEGDKVTTRKRISGTHTGKLMGIPATGWDVVIDVIDIVRLRGGKYVEHWGINSLPSTLASLRAK